MNPDNDIELRDILNALDTPVQLALFPTSRLAKLFETDRLSADTIKKHCAAVLESYRSLGDQINVHLRKHGCGEPLETANCGLRIERHRQPFLTMCPWCKKTNVTARLVHEKNFQLSRTDRLLRRLGNNCDHALPLNPEQQIIVVNMQCYEDQVERFPWVIDLLREPANHPAPSA